MPPGYLDWASTAPLHPVAREALLDALDRGFADPGRRYGAARRAALAYQGATEQIAELLGARADELAFPASGTASVQMALTGARSARRRTGSRVVHSAVEHSAVLQVAGDTEAAAVAVDRQGRLDLDAFATAVRRPGVAVASVQSANHEVGTLQPLPEVAAACRAAGVPLHVDACQSIGRLAAPAHWDLLTASAHKWGGPAGVGVLAIRTGVRWRPPLPAGKRGGGRVPGFENVPAVVAAAAALAAREGERAAEAVRLTGWIERLRREIPLSVPDAEVLGPADPAGRLPHLLTVSFLYADGEALLAELDAAGLAVSSGSSCTSDTLEPSHVLVAMGALTHGNVRISLGPRSSGTRRPPDRGGPPQFPPSLSDRSASHTPGDPWRLRFQALHRLRDLHRDFSGSASPAPHLTAETSNDAADFTSCCGPVSRSPSQGFRHWASTPGVSPRRRQSATGPPGSYPGRTHTGKRRRTSTEHDPYDTRVTSSPAGRTKDRG